MSASESSKPGRDTAWGLSVAPMMDWTDRHCRYFHRLLAPHARLYTEMVHAQAVLHGDRTRLLGFNRAEHPLALQLGGSDPAQLAQAALIGADLGYDEINLNIGCPSDRVQAGRFGACLMREPVLVADCIAAMIDGLNRVGMRVPVTVKCRLGVDDQDDYAQFRCFVDRVADAGCGVFLVHARNAWLQGLSPKENREVPPLKHAWVHRLKRERPDLIVLINGGIVTLEDALAHVPRVDGVVLGRAAYHDPYLLYRLDSAMYGTPVSGMLGVGLIAREELLRRLRPYIEARLYEGVALKHVVRHVLGLFHGQPGGRAFRQVLSEGSHRPDAGWELIEQALAVTRRPRREAA